MKSRTRLVPLLALAVAFMARAAAACPFGPDRTTVEKEIYSEWGVVQPSTVPVDYVAFLQPMENPNACFVVISRSDHGACHDCGATISILEIAQTGRSWKRTFEQRDAFSLGSFGHAPQPTLVNLGGPAFRFDLSGMQMGTIGNSLVLVGKVNDEFREVLDVPTHGDNSGAGDGEEWGWTGDIQLVSAYSRWPDVRITFTGTELKDGAKKITPVNRVELYHFTGEGYELVPSPDKQPHF